MVQCYCGCRSVLCVWLMCAPSPLLLTYWDDSFICLLCVLLCEDDFFFFFFFFEKWTGPLGGFPHPPPPPSPCFDWMQPFTGDVCDQAAAEMRLQWTSFL